MFKQVEGSNGDFCEEFKKNPNQMRLEQCSSDFI